MDAAGTAIVNRLIDVMADKGRLPLAEITALQRSGHVVRIEQADDRVVAVVGRRSDACFEQLTEREREVASVVALGLTNRQIARRLGISPATVKDHVHAILVKTGFESRTQMVAAYYGGLPVGGV